MIKAMKEGGNKPGEVSENLMRKLYNIEKKMVKK